MSELITIDTDDTDDTLPARWGDSVRDLAYQHWAYVSGRNAERVASALAALGHPVTSRTVRRWADDGAWAQRAHDDLGRIAPDIRQQTIAELIYGGLEAARILRDLVGQEEPNKARITAALGLLDRAGFSPVGSNAPELPRVSVAQQAEDYRALSPEQRRARERELKDGQSVAIPRRTPRRKR